VWSGQRLIPKGYALRVPRNPLRPDPEVVLASVPTSERVREQVREAEYRVTRGDTLSRIAARHGVRTKDLMAANGLRSAHHIRVGQVLEIPGRARTQSAAPAPTRTVSTGATSYRVRSGDTLGRIARQLGVSERALAAENGIQDRSLVRVGQVLRVPGSAKGSDSGASTSRGGVYTVRRGDTIDSIAKRHGVATHSIVALNGLASANRNKAGQRLYLPKN
jgi:LysM repeat protein